jgi:Flp pilus assembly protein TadD
MIKIENANKFNDYITVATSKLQNDEVDESYNVILKALKANPNAPEPHNLLGIWYEFRGNNDLARKHYRAAYALDPTYKPASENLERVCTLFTIRNIPIDFGEQTLEITNNEKMS